VWIVVASNAWKKPCDRGIDDLGTISRTTPMQNAVHRNIRPNGAVTAVWRLAILASFGGLALTVLALPVSLESDGLAWNPAFAASENSNAGGSGKDKGSESAPGQQPQEDFVDSKDAPNNDAGSALAGSGESVVDASIMPIAEDGPATTNVIKEIAGLAGDAELSDEEEREAIHSGWGTWRTADGPDTVVAQ
jgi:hypothetical protein